MRPWNALMACAILMLAATLAFDLLVPAPSTSKSAQARLRNEREIREKTHDLKARYEAARAEIRSRVWVGSADTVGAKVLERSTAVAKSKGMNLTAFRPQKAVEEGELTRLAFVMTLEGRFPGLQSVVKELETPSNRLSVHLVQVASADEASDLVNATVGVTAFLEKPKTTPETKDKKN